MLSDSEKDWLENAKSADNNTNRLQSLQLYGGADMYHSLHCLDALRKAADGRMNRQYEKIQINLSRLHLDHCIEQLRQAILCHSDLTPVTLRPIFDREARVLVLLGQTKYTHTCRDWANLKASLEMRHGLEADITVE